MAPPATFATSLLQISKARFLLLALLLCVFFFWTLRPADESWADYTWSSTHVEVPKVPLEAHIMSKCPDARDCLEYLVLPAMAQVSNRVDFQLSYIGTPTNHNDGIECMHGETECLGNIVELCAANLYPDPKRYLGFTMCLSKQYQLIPDRDLIADCALEYGLSFERLNECMSQEDGAYGMGLLRSSVERSAEANVTYSCTIRLNEEIRCVRDDGTWKQCERGSSVESLIADIDDIYNKLETPPTTSGVPGER
ncbi:hypothetical protein P152DRAFT_456365 [Eremomyces bilateralis CBS 781.70]|uniref:Gamma interferon inducible lysosomal thiol reductase n=1 Tax=Eremomyces bilateralis CBS 781.70 TaxID=1392243 RepID=A0A6G1G876_9PEZI|nr:uncharacterized protein P152DRAFT_456365 [Eremomyces bilateralis CBS 781.70]KAF1814136.1 hypothetical protein P152DRAFT_456365 [Eremomyces bilateralis CBS 781.70]